MEGGGYEQDDRRRRMEVPYPSQDGAPMPICKEIKGSVPGNLHLPVKKKSLGSDRSYPTLPRLNSPVKVPSIGYLGNYLSDTPYTSYPESGHLSDTVLLRPDFSSVCFGSPCFSFLDAQQKTQVGMPCLRKHDPSTKVYR